MNRLKAIITIVISLLSFITAGADSPKSRQIAVHGLVKAASTNIQLTDADVVIISPDATDSISTKAKSYSQKGTRNMRQFVETSEFYLTIPDVKPGEYLLTIDYPGYKQFMTSLNFADLGSREFTRDLGTFYLEREMAKTLDEVNVTASKVKFYNKGDTIVYNADAFNLAEGSMLDALIKQLPGVELKDGGQIYVNGRYVESLLLNGKDFFKGKNQVMLENLGAYTVKDVQVYEKDTDMNRFIGEQVEKKEFVMDVNLKKEYIGGWTINAEGGYGTEDRYMGRLFALNFSAKQRFTFFANANNLNDSRRPGENDSWRPENQQSGLLRHLESGFDYNFDFGQDDKSYITGNAIAKQDRGHLSQTADAVKFYPSGNMSSRNLSDNIHRNLSLNTSHKLYVEKQQFNITIEPSLDYDRSRSRSLSRDLNLNVERPADEVAADMDKIFTTGLGSIDRDQLINATYSSAFSGSNRLRFSTKAYSNIKVPKTSDYINIFLQYNHSNDRNDHSEDYMIGYGDPADKPLYRRQRTADRPNHSNAYIAEFYYNYRLSSSWRIGLNANTRYDHTSKRSDFYLAQASAEASGDFTLDNLLGLTATPDPANSYISTETSHRIELNPGISYNNSKKGIYFHADIPVAYMNRHLDYVRWGAPSPVADRRWVVRNASVVMQFHKSKDENYKYIAVHYNFRSDLPNLSRMLDITDTTNPLNTYLGNRNLRTTLNQSIDLHSAISMRNNYQFSIHFSNSLSHNQVISCQTYDTSTGHSTHKWENSPEMLYSLSQSIYGTKYFGPDNCFSVSASFQARESRDAQMIGENSISPVLYKMDNFYYTPALSLKYEIGKQQIEAFGEIEFRHSTSTRQQSADINSRDFKYGLRGNFNLPCDFGISTDLTVYQRRGYGSDLLNSSDLVWNARLSKSFNKGRWLLAVDGFDLLRQLSNITYHVSPSGRTERFTNTLPRYILFHVQYKINIMPKRKELKSNVIRF